MVKTDDVVNKSRLGNKAVEGNLIDALPNDILVSILSLLNSEEVARTSILSHRWRFINWVNNTLKSHQGTTIDEFTVCFVVDVDVDEGSYCKPDINGWIIFAFEKKVRSLHLDFKKSWENYNPWENYTLTTQFLSNYTIGSLEVLRLIDVEVTGEVVEYILSACPLLEVLRIEGSESLAQLNVSGPSLKLKSLEIIHCLELEYIEISSVPNLMSLTYFGEIVIGVVKDVPNLIKASISGFFASHFMKKNCHYSGLLSQLKTLVLDLSMEQICRSSSKLPKLKNLKHLELVLDGEDFHSLVCCVKFLKMSPFLHRLTLKVENLGRFRKFREVNEEEPEKAHRHLKLIEFIGFVGLAVDMELILCLLKSAVSLKRLTIVPCTKYYFGAVIPTKDAELISAARRRAKKLETRLPPSAELVIL
ncbi:hypothetical protein COLO4_29714 [Corchorus olitorius]|uniref:F-box domain-containing protein n=1 Tax=Corchorus olitorius TaxID=93759 RepID=A0A1R3HDD5_9ROSI|nr:hypothetical protein COLO4_29714 [Corchorus olitorius]